MSTIAKTDSNVVSLVSDKRYVIAESCSAAYVDIKGKSVEPEKVYIKLCDKKLYAYCNECEDGGCMVEVW
jgi:hypothetical protein